MVKTPGFVEFVRRLLTNLLRQNTDADLPGCSADDKEENDRSLIRRTAKPDRSLGIRCLIEFRLIQINFMFWRNNSSQRTICGPARSCLKPAASRRSGSSKILNLKRAEADLRIAMLTAKLKLLDGPPHTL